MIIDIDDLRSDLINYFGTASSYNPVTMMDLIEVERASDEKVVQIALQNGFDLGKYEVTTNDRTR